MQKKHVTSVYVHKVLAEMRDNPFITTPVSTEELEAALEYHQREQLRHQMEAQRLQRILLEVGHD